MMTRGIFPEIIGLMLLAGLYSSQTRADVLAVPEVFQEQTQWCWAGVSRAVLLYYGSDVAECTIAEYTRTVATWHDFGSVDCCVDPSQGCNYWNYNAGVTGSIQDILTHWGVSNSGRLRALTQAEVGSEVSAWRPFIIRWAWSSGGGHFVVGHGIEGDDLYYMNPWFGEGLKVGTYSWVVSGDSHTWTHTNVMSAQPACLCDRLDVCCDGCRPFVDGLVCDDENVCTANDVCQAGTCLGAAIADGTACDDGDLCTQTDSCQAGVCSGANPVTCSPSDQCHVAGVCDRQTGLCSDPAAADETSCDDGNQCTQTDSCQAGVCSGADPVSCSPSDQCHVTGVCDSQTGLCSDPAKDDGTSCDDGDQCTQTDSCQAGLCSGADPVICSQSDQCHVAGICDPQTGQCPDPVATDGTACDDGDPCMQGEVCRAGVCGGASPVVCEPSDQCHLAGECDPASGACSNPAAPDGKSCDDGDACSLNEACQSGACVSTSILDCDDQDPCTSGECDAQQGCLHSPKECKSQGGCSCATDERWNGSVIVALLALLIGLFPKRRRTRNKP